MIHIKYLRNVTKDYLIFTFNLNIKKKDEAKQNIRN